MLLSINLHNRLPWEDFNSHKSQHTGQLDRLLFKFFIDGITLSSDVLYSIGPGNALKYKDNLLHLLIGNSL